MMIISIIGILLLAGGVFSSVPVQGLISIIHDGTMSIDLRASKLSVGNNLDILIEQLRGLEKPRVRLLIDLGRRIIKINGETELEQDALDKVENDIESILQRMTLLMQHAIVPQDYQGPMNLDKNDFSWMLSNPESALEMKRLISRNELSLEYTKMAEHVLLWLIKLFDVNWQQLHDDLDYISKWRLLNLQRQAELLLENLVADNQRRHRKSKDDKYILEDENNSISSTEKIEEASGQNKGNLIKTNKTENISTNKSPENPPRDRITSTTETQIVNNSELIKHIEDNIKNNFTSITSMNKKFTFNSMKDNLINSTFVSKIKTLRDKDFIRNETASKSKKFLSTLYDLRVKDRGKQFGQLKNDSSISPNENITSILQKTDQSKRVGMNATLPGSLKNGTNVSKTASRRTLQVLGPSNKNEEHKNRQLSTEKVSDKHHHFNKGMKIKSDSASAMDDILEAVDKVFVNG